jgi:hypothetical protein
MQKKAPDTVAGKDAEAAAASWLGVVDSGKYADSWDSTSGYFQGIVKRDQLVQQLSSVRRPMGEKVTRQLQSSTAETSMPGAPDGNYVVLLLNTEFTKKKSAVETVCMVEDNGWKVSGYYIK